MKNIIEGDDLLSELKTFPVKAQTTGGINKTLARVRQFIPLYILFIPVLIYYLVFAYAPMAGIIIAFKNYNFLDGIFGSKWAGIQHFERFLTNKDFWIIFKNTLILALYRIAFGFPAPIIFAVLIYEVRFSKIKRIFQTVSYLPHFISWVVIYGIVYNFFSSTGLVNQITKALGGEAVNYLGSTKYFRALFVGSAIWKEIGWGAIIYLAALTNVDVELYDAALIDGCNRFQKLIYVTLPSIRSMVSIMFVLALGGILSVSFEQVMVMINPTVSSVAEVLDYYIYRIGLLNVNNYSYATAIGLFRSVIALAIVLLTNWGAKKIDEEGAIW